VDYRVKLGPKDRMTLGITLLVYKTLDGLFTYAGFEKLLNPLLSSSSDFSNGLFFLGGGAGEVEL